MNYLTVTDILAIHTASIEAFGGESGIHSQVLLESAVVQPQMSGFGEEFYPTIAEKAACLCFGITANHVFKDGNKRTGYTAMEAFVRLNGYSFVCSNEEAERVTLAVADGSMDRSELVTWASGCIQSLTQ